MTEEATPATLGQWLRETYGAAGAESGAQPCPPPASFHELASGVLTEEAAAALTRHAAHCPACAAELDLAQAFVVAPEGVDATLLAGVVSQVEGALPVHPVQGPAEEPRVLPFPGARAAPRPMGQPSAQPVPQTRARPSKNLRTFGRWAAAALVVLAAGLGYRGLNTSTPALPAPDDSEVVRGSEVEVLSPSGELAELPRELHWSPYRGAASYRVRLLAVDDSVLWEETAATERIALPAELLAKVHRAVAYRWTVEALDVAGRPLAVSEVTRFLARPTP